MTHPHTRFSVLKARVRRARWASQNSPQPIASPTMSTSKSRPSSNTSPRPLPISCSASCATPARTSKAYPRSPAQPWEGRQCQPAQQRKQRGVPDGVLRVGGEGAHDHVAKRVPVLAQPFKREDNEAQQRQQRRGAARTERVQQCVHGMLLHDDERRMTNDHRECTAKSAKISGT